MYKRIDKRLGESYVNFIPQLKVTYLGCRLYYVRNTKQKANSYHVFITACDPYNGLAFKINIIILKAHCTHTIRPIFTYKNVINAWVEVTAVAIY